MDLKVELRTVGRGEKAFITIKDFENKTVQDVCLQLATSHPDIELDSSYFRNESLVSALQVHKPNLDSSISIWLVANSPDVQPFDHRICLCCGDNRIIGFRHHCFQCGECVCSKCIQMVKDKQFLCLKCVRRPDRQLFCMHCAVISNVVTCAECKHKVCKNCTDNASVAKRMCNMCSHKFYTIVVSNSFDSLDENNYFKLESRKRYSDFVTLEMDLKSINSNHKFSSLPTKKNTNMNDRCILLENFLKSVLRCANNSNEHFIKIRLHSFLLENSYYKQTKQPQLNCKNNKENLVDQIDSQNLTSVNDLNARRDQ